MLKSITRSLTPPLIWQSVRWIKSRFNEPTSDKVDPDTPHLFDGDAFLFLEHAPHASIYGEYGVGQSTLWMAENSHAKMTGVDTSKAWIDKIAGDLPPDRVRLVHVDVGALGDWGRPLDYDQRARFPDYAEALWNGPLKPDLVLIDGRFRVACFLTSLAYAAPGTKVIFDDYLNRPHYHLVEEYLEPTARSERQALFVVPEAVNRETLLVEAARFAMVID